MIEFLVLLMIAALAFWAVGFFYLRGRDLSAFDQPTGQRFSTSDTLNAEHRAVNAVLHKLADSLKATPHRRRLPLLREVMDTLFAGRQFAATFTPVDAGGVAAEWVMAPNADRGKRMLYIHGGAFMMGSPLSHRTLTSRFAEITGGAVLVIDYRLMPEHPRMAGIEDCRSAYRWLLEHGPEGVAPASKIFVAGDSAGGNLTLSLIAWVRDQGLRAPDAAVALSPFTDATLGSPSLRGHLATDPMLGPLFRHLLNVPRTLLLWLGWWQTRLRPCDPVISPVYGDLSRLPPVLVHSSEVEMLFDDSRRYVNRAVAAGSPVRLQYWNHMVHVWQIFHPELTEARDAFEEIRKFLDQPLSVTAPN
jgi:acetyl esterase/lipase